MDTKHPSVVTERQSIARWLRYAIRQAGKVIDRTNEVFGIFSFQSYLLDKKW
jgi:hypothetical protein